MKYSFRTHTGGVLPSNDSRLIAACETVAQWQESNAKAIYEENAYASHVTQEQKEKELSEYRAWAEKTRSRENLSNFSVWQRVNTELTGECIAFLPKTEGKNHD